MITQTAPAAQTRAASAIDFRSLEGFGSLSSIWGSCLQELQRGNRCCRFRHDRIRLREPAQCGVVVAGVVEVQPAGHAVQHLPGEAPRRRRDASAGIQKFNFWEKLNFYGLVPQLRRAFAGRAVRRD